MLGREVRDPEGVESGGSIRGIGLLPIETVLTKQKLRAQVAGRFGEPGGALRQLGGMAFCGYEIHMGITRVWGEMEHDPHLTLLHTAAGDARPDGLSVGNVYGSYVHGLFDEGAIAETILRTLAAQKGIDFTAPEFADYRAFKESQYALLADTVRESLNMKELYRFMQEAYDAGRTV